MYFTRMAAQQGCIGLLMSNASPAMSAWGGREKMIGTNPWSVCAPVSLSSTSSTTPFYPPLMMDIANTTVARGKLYVAKEKGQAIPLDWALDDQGAPTSDPAAGIAGVILPMAGHKGRSILLPGHIHPLPPSCCPSFFTSVASFPIDRYLMTYTYICKMTYVYMPFHIQATPLPLSMMSCQAF